MQNSFTHIVLFWFHEPENKGHRELFEDSLLEFINSSDYLSSGRIGKPAGTDRAVVDNSYTYSLIVEFRSSEKHDLYQAEPAHKKFIKECEHVWSKVQVFDTIRL